MDLGGDSIAGNLPTPVDLALDQLCTGLDHLVKLVEDGGLESLDDAGLVGFLQGSSGCGTGCHWWTMPRSLMWWPGICPAKLTQATVQRMLASTLRLSPGEAAWRVRAAEAVGCRMSMLGEPLEPVRPHVAAVQRAGEINPEQVGIIERAFPRVDRPRFAPPMWRPGRSY